MLWNYLRKMRLKIVRFFCKDLRFNGYKQKVCGIEHSYCTYDTCPKLKGGRNANTSREQETLSSELE